MLSLVPEFLVADCVADGSMLLEVAFRTEGLWSKLSFVPEFLVTASAPDGSISVDAAFLTEGLVLSSPVFCLAEIPSLAVPSADLTSLAIGLRT